MAEKITRRLALALSGGALAPGQSRKLPFGFSLYGARSLPWREGIDLVARIGYRCTELCLRAGWNTEPKLLNKQDRVEIRKRLSDRGLALSSVMENMVPGRPDGLSTNLGRLRAAAEICHECSPGSPALIETTLGGRPEMWEERKNAMAEELAGWGREAERLGTTVAIKPHSKLAMRRPEHALWVLEQVNSSRIRLVYDYSHYEVQKLDMRATMGQIVPHAVFVHIKDSTGPGPEFKFLLPGDGKIDYQGYQKAITELGYRGPIMVEVSVDVFGLPGYDPAMAAQRVLGQAVACTRVTGRPGPPELRPNQGERSPLHHPLPHVGLFRTRSAAVFGIDAHLIDVEVDLYSSGSSRDFITVGMPDTAVRESRERIKSALLNSGFGYPAKAVTINLAPANVRKEGAGFDLPMALGILGAMGTVRDTENFVLVGELGLDGGLRPVRGALPIAVCARRERVPNVIVPAENAGESSVVDGVRVFGARHIAEAVAMLNDPEKFSPQKPTMAAPAEREEKLDFADVRGQAMAKRAIEVAAAGAHNVLLIGPPGSGKTMLARRLPSILPPLTFDEAIETTKIHSVAGILPKGAALLCERPFRSPHHTISDAGMIGGGSGMVRPGEASLAHNGVLFLDEMPEFPRNVLELLRQPLEGRQVSLARSTMTLSFPASFMLIGGMNPCPCGYYGDAARECRCTGAIIQRYLSKISGPLLDRIDLHIEVPAVPYKEMRGREEGMSSAPMRERVLRARERQRSRGFYNAEIPPSELPKLCALDDAGERTLEMAVRRLNLSARAHDRVLKVARTIADIGGSEGVSARHLAEAVQYRSLDRSYWGS